MATPPFQRAVVIGLGKSGAAACALLRARGVAVVGVDDQKNHPAAPELSGLGVELKLGLPWPELSSLAPIAVVSPGVPGNRSEIVRARAVGVEVIGEIELAVRMFPQAAGPILGITGTNGKSTTTALLGHIFATAGRDVFVGGNLGRPLSEACQRAFAVHVVELSSFQLEGMTKAACFGAAWLNLTPDHLDRYPNQGDYAAAKARIFDRQPPDGFGVVNADDAMVMSHSTHARRRFGFSQRGSHAFAGDLLGGVVADGTKLRVLMAPGGELEVHTRTLRGQHNVANAMAAVAMALNAGVDRLAVQQGLDTYPGLPHRLEWIRELAGVEWLNDSKATNVESSLVALRAVDRPMILIAGGKGKGAPYAPMVSAAAGKVKCVLTIGEDAPAIEQAFAGVVPTLACQTLDKAVNQAQKSAVAGDTVLLSPACASYDQFRNFEHRGETFRRLVEAL